MHRRANEDRVTLVTGGSGFIGSHLVERLVGEGRRVLIIDDFSTGRRENLSHVAADAIEVLEGTVGAMLPRVDPARVDEIYHLAAAVGVRLVIEQPIRTIETNVNETSAILAFAAEDRLPILLASTSEVYGKSDKVPFSEDDDVVYGPTTLPRWSYACSKAIDEHLGLAWHRERGVPVAIARFFNTVGPRQIGTYGMVLPRFVDRALAGAPLQVHGDGRQTRCFCDVRDVVALLPVLLAEPRAAGRVFNVGHDESISIEDLARLVVRTLGSSSAIEHVPYAEAFGPDFDDLRDRVPDLSRLRGLTGFRPERTLPETIRDLAASLQAEAAAAASRP